MPADKDNERWYLSQKVGGVYGQIVDNPHIDEKGAPVWSDRCCNSDHGLRLFVSSLGHWGNPVDQGDDQAASCSKRTHAGARIISRKIGKLKAAIPSLGCRGF